MQAVERTESGSGPHSNPSGWWHWLPLALTEIKTSPAPSSSHTMSNTRRFLPSTRVRDSEVLAGWYTAEFEQMYVEGKYHGRKPKPSGEKRVQLPGAQLEVYFSPQESPISSAYARPAPVAHRRQERSSHVRAGHARVRHRPL